LLLQRCEPPGEGARGLQDHVPSFREIQVLFRGFVRLGNRDFVGPSQPVRRSPFPAASFGISCRSVLSMGFTPPTILSAGSPSPRSRSLVNCTRMARSRCASHAVLSPTTLDRNRRPYHPASFQPPAPSVLRVSHPLDVLLRLQPWRACFIPPASLGLSPDLHCSPRPFDQGRAAAPGFPLQGFLSHHDEHVLACSPLVHFVQIPGEGAFR